jgi:hypothetical protein
MRHIGFRADPLPVPARGTVKSWPPVPGRLPPCAAWRHEHCTWPSSVPTLFILQRRQKKDADARQTTKPPMSAVSRAVARLSSRHPARRILITGATSGSGEALAVLFGRQRFRAST